MQSVLGRYISADSFLHRMDPRIKVFLDILLIVLVFMISRFFTFIFLAIPVILIFLLSKNSPKKLFSTLKPVLFLGIFLLFINFFTVKPTANGSDINVYSQWWVFYFSQEAIERAAKIMIRVYFMIIITSLLTATTKQLDLTRGLEDLMTPLKIIKFPTHIIAMVISIALRFIPTLLEESLRIMKAQASRGVDFKNGGFRTKIKTTVVLVIPLFVSSFAKAEDLANAMETRGYDPYAKRTRYRQYQITFLDVVALLIVMAALGTIISISAGWIDLPTWWY